MTTELTRQEWLRIEQAIKSMEIKPMRKEMRYCHRCGIPLLSTAWRVTGFDPESGKGEGRIRRLRCRSKNVLNTHADYVEIRTAGAAMHEHVYRREELDGRRHAVQGAPYIDPLSD
jgi:hypothetical protein